MAGQYQRVQTAPDKLGMTHSMNRVYVHYSELKKTLAKYVVECDLTGHLTGSKVSDPAFVQAIKSLKYNDPGRPAQKLDLDVDTVNGYLMVLPMSDCG